MRQEIVAAVSIILSVCAFAQTQKRIPKPAHIEAVAATVCDIANNPERYDGKLVRVPAVLALGFEISALRDEERKCNDIWLADSDSTDSSLNELAKYSLPRLRNKKRPRDYAPPRYSINATFVGRLQYTHNSGFVVDSHHRVTGIKGGFGHLGQYKTQLLLHSVTDLHPRDLLGSVYKTNEYEPLKD